MPKNWILFVFFCTCSTSITCDDDLDLTAENVRYAICDFAQGLSDVQEETIDSKSRRRNLLSIEDAISKIPHIDDIDFDIDLSDFVAGLLNPQIFDLAKDTPATNAEWENTIKEKYKEFCTEPEKEDSAILLQKCEGPEITFELVPGICKVVNREHSEFECKPPRLEYHRSGSQCTSSYRRAAKFIDKECKFVRQLGDEKTLILGGGIMDTELEFGKRRIGATSDIDVSDILDIVSNLFSDLRDFPDITHLASILS